MSQTTPTHLTTKSGGRRRLIALVTVLIAAAAVAVVFRDRVAISLAMVRGRIVKKTVADRLAEFGSAARARWQPHFTRAGVKYPPAKAILLVCKEERVVHVYGSNVSSNLAFVRTIGVTAASGRLGPKLREGDGQVPEGIYRIEWLNPNSAYHVSMRLNYPNEFDRARAREEGRSQLGGDIMIHGKAVSIGCVAVGDEAAEDLFALTADAGMENIEVIMSPVDWRKRKEPLRLANAPKWTDQLHAQIRERVRLLPER